MNKPQYRKLEEHYEKTRRLNKKIESIEKLIRSMQRRIKEDVRVFDVWITNGARRHSFNISTEFTADTFKKVMLPLLKERLTELRIEYKAIPPVIIKEAPNE